MNNTNKLREKETKEEKYKGSVIQRAKKKEKKMENRKKRKRKRDRNIITKLPETPNSPPLQYQEVVKSRAETMRRLGRKERKITELFKIKGFTKTCEQMEMPQAEEKDANRKLNKNRKR